jgi:hypothetical protein
MPRRERRSRPACHADFGGLGFLRIARERWVPVVPMGFRGVSAPILHRSRLLGYLFAWAFAASPLALLPCVPARIRIRIGAPIAPEALFGARDASDSDVALRSALALVGDAVTRLQR